MSEWTIEFLSDNRDVTWPQQNAFSGKVGGGDAGKKGKGPDSEGEGDSEGRRQTCGVLALHLVDFLKASSDAKDTLVLASVGLKECNRLADERRHLLCVPSDPRDRVPILSRALLRVVSRLSRVCPCECFGSGARTGQGGPLAHIRRLAHGIARGTARVERGKPTELEDSEPPLPLSFFLGAIEKKKKKRKKFRSVLHSRGALGGQHGQTNGRKRSAWRRVRSGTS